jgi:hypothetical protein
MGSPVPPGRQRSRSSPPIPPMCWRSGPSCSNPIVIHPRSENGSSIADAAFSRQNFGRNCDHCAQALEDSALPRCPAALDSGRDSLLAHIQSVRPAFLRSSFSIPAHPSVSACALPLKASTRAGSLGRATSSTRLCPHGDRPHAPAEGLSPIRSGAPP